MLNSCIERKISCENRHHSKYDSAEEDSSTDDEFFDCSEKPVEEIRKRVKHSLWNQPVGRLSKFGDLKLLKTGDPLFIPITQDPVLKTEDQLEEDTDVLLKLGSDAEATELRARIMSASLLSDMESFKAANPGSIVEDFIRWYSPRDWIEEDETDEWGQKKGHLSPRMMIEENNIWVQMWKSAKPVPASRQKRLFDDTREAEKVLQFLEMRNVSQDPVLKTEDQLEEDTDVLLKLGSDAEATELRARIMSASLLSDMESFKAANPGSIVEDFIRWYSPRDWIEEDETDEWGQKKGHLSPRMMIEENNIWVQMWKSAKPVPASRQKRLFDDTREAEKVLQFLEMRNVSQIADLVIPVLAHAAIYRLVEECRFIAAELSESAVNLPALLRQGARLSREPKLPSRRFENFIQEMSALELLISQINSLQYKFNPSGAADAVITDAVTNLVVGREVEIDGKKDSPLGSRILSMFVDAGLVVKESSEEGATRAVRHVFPAPMERDFVLRTNAVRPARYSAKCPQFLRAISSNKENRLAGAFSEDIVFF